MKQNLKHFHLSNSWGQGLKFMTCRCQGALGSSNHIAFFMIAYVFKILQETIVPWKQGKQYQLCKLLVEKPELLHHGFCVKLMKDLQYLTCGAYTIAFPEFAISCGV